jgi:hypothetical protein
MDGELQTLIQRLERAQENDGLATVSNFTCSLLLQVQPMFINVYSSCSLFVTLVNPILFGLTFWYVYFNRSDKVLLMWITLQRDSLPGTPVHASTSPMALSTPTCCTSINDPVEPSMPCRDHDRWALERRETFSPFSSPGVRFTGWDSQVSINLWVLPSFIPSVIQPFSSPFYSTNTEPFMMHDGSIDGPVVPSTPRHDHDQQALERRETFSPFSSPGIRFTGWDSQVSINLQSCRLPSSSSHWLSSCSPAPSIQLILSPS